MVALLPLLAACPGGDDDDTSGQADDDDTTVDPGASPYSLDDVLQLPHIQAKGTHNSYHIEPDTLFDSSHRYTHDPLDVQLEEHGVRQFELDVHYREGEGFQVFHLPLFDDETTCLRWVDCLQTIKDWSDAHPWHVPIMIWFEPKDDVDALDDTLLELSGRWDELEEETLSVFPRDGIVTPDDVRGGYDTLPEAIAAQGWPTLGEMRGTVIFSMLDGGEHRDDYLGDALNLAGKLMFVHGDGVDAPFSATFKMNDGTDPEVAVRVAAGFLVTSNAGQAPDGGEDHWAASLAGGPNFLSTDFPAVRDEGWFATLPGGAPARCNPVSAPAECTSAEVETLPD
jgi:hypothetical protein